MTIEQMNAKKRELGYSNRELAALSGVPEVTLQKILSGKTTAPRRETLLKIEQALTASSSGMVRESQPAYGKKQGGYTLADYLALPDEERVELIDGVFYDMAAPHAGHQAFAGFMHKIFMDFVMENGGPCFPMMSPIDVQLDCDDRTVVQPDVLIVCDRSKFQNGRVMGAPDLVVEVLSPSTRKKDMYLKLMKYKEAGVREYWMIDQVRKVVIVNDLENEAPPLIYGFQDSVPVGIWDGKCKVDFGEIYPRIEFLYE